MKKLIVGVVAALTAAPLLLTAPPAQANHALPAPLIAWPDADNTGDIGGNNTTVNGDLHTSSNGQHLTDVKVTGTLYIEHDNVTLTFSRIVGMVEVEPGADGFRLWNVGIGSTTGVNPEGQALRGEFTGRRLELYGTLDGIKGTESFDLQDSFLHGFYDDGVTHSDCIHIQRGGPYLIQHNNLRCWGWGAGEQFDENDGITPYTGEGFMTSGIIMAPLDDIAGVTINNNRLRGATAKHIIVGEGDGVSTVSNVDVTNNKVGPDNRDWPQWMPGSSEPAIDVRSGNTVIGTGASAD